MVIRGCSVLSAFGPLLSLVAIFTADFNVWYFLFISLHAIPKFNNKLVLQAIVAHQSMDMILPLFSVNLTGLQKCFRVTIHDYEDSNYNTS